ncbi:MAG: carboxypeptidase regulatory-like domain-containing protein [Pyrinomonadaceae bacterium]
MKSSIHRYSSPVFNPAILLVSALLLLLNAATNAWPQARPQRARPPQLATGESTAKGRVIYRDNQEPLKGARLRIFTSGEDQGELIVFTNDRGEFRVDNLAAGKYYVAIEGPRVAAPSGFGMRIPLPMSAIPRAEDFGEIIPRHDAEFTVDGTNSLDVDIRVERGGKLAGKVLKPDGAPAGDVSVSLVSRDGRGAGPYTARFSTQTGKDGAYRFENLPVGDYVVAAAVEDKQKVIDVRARLRGETQIVTYHPAATKLNDAMTVHVDSGSAVGGVNITLVARNSFSVSGILVRQRDGTALAGATVLLRNKESDLGGALVPGMSQRTTRTNAEGHWSFSNVAEGSYTITALSSPPRPTRPNGGPPDREEAFRRSRQRYLVAQQDIIVTGGNFTDLMLSITGSGSITGAVELDNGQALPPGLVIFVELVRAGGRPGPPLPVRVQPDGSFSFSEVQGGDVYLSAALPPGSNFFVKSVTANGKDLRGIPLNVIEDTIAGPVRVVLSLESARITGRVLADKNEAASDFVVLLAPVESDKGRFRTGYFSTKSGPDGSYSLTVPPGEYFVFVRRRDKLPGIVSEEFVKKEAGKAMRVNVAASEQKRLDLRAQ